MSKLNIEDRIAAIKAECERVIELSEKATAGPWESDGDVIDNCMGVIHCDTQSGSVADASLIAHSRNVSPAMARVVLVTIKNIEFASRVDKLRDGALEAATELVNQWEGK